MVDVGKLWDIFVHGWFIGCVIIMVVYHVIGAVGDVVEKFKRRNNG